jgi:hypothetical protein
MPDGWEWITEIAEARSQDPDAAAERVTDLIRRNRDVRHASIFFATVRARMVDALNAFNETASDAIRFDVSGDPARVEQPLIFRREGPRHARMEVTLSATLMTVASAWRNDQRRQADVMWQDDGRNQVVHRHNQSGEVVAYSTQSVETLVRDLLEEFVKSA